MILLIFIDLPNDLSRCQSPVLPDGLGFQIDLQDLILFELDPEGCEPVDRVIHADEDLHLPGYHCFLYCPGCVLIQPV